MCGKLEHVQVAIPEEQIAHVVLRALPPSYHPLRLQVDMDPTGFTLSKIELLPEICNAAGRAMRTGDQVGHGERFGLAYFTRRLVQASGGAMSVDCSQSGGSVRSVWQHEYGSITEREASDLLPGDFRG